MGWMDSMDSMDSIDWTRWDGNIISFAVNLCNNLFKLILEKKREDGDNVYGESM